MKTKDVKRIVTDNLPKLKNMLGLGDWSIIVEYRKVDLPRERERELGGIDGAGLCEPLINYHQAFITIDPKQMDNKKDVIETLRHELLHGILAAFNTYQEAAEVGASPKEQEVLDIIYTRAVEEVVRAIEKIIDYR